MIEIFDSSCSRSLGQPGSIRAAIDILNAPSAAGRPGTNAMLCTYRGSSPRQEYIAVCRDGKWRRRYVVRRRALFAVKLGRMQAPNHLPPCRPGFTPFSGCPKMCGRALAAPVCFCMAAGV